MSHVVVAPDKFKGTLTATAVARHVAAGLARVRPELSLVQAPVADGGDGTVGAAAAPGGEQHRGGVSRTRRPRRPGTAGASRGSAGRPARRSRRDTLSSRRQLS